MIVGNVVLIVGSSCTSPGAPACYYAAVCGICTGIGMIAVGP